MDQQKMLTDILERTVRMETKIDQLAKIETTADEAKATANEALVSARSAHKRQDKFDKIIWWVATTVIGAVIVALLALVFQK